MGDDGRLGADHGPLGNAAAQELRYEASDEGSRR